MLSVTSNVTGATQCATQERLKNLVRSAIAFGLTPEFSCVGAGLELSRSRSVARPRQLQRSVGQRRAIENERNRRATTETGRLPVTRWPPAVTSYTTFAAPIATARPSSSVPRLTAPGSRPVGERRARTSAQARPLAPRLPPPRPPPPCT